MHHPRRVTSLLGAVLAASLTLAITGCTSEPVTEHDPPPHQQAETNASPTLDESPTAAADPEQTAIDQRVADAIKRYEEFTEITNASLQQGKSPYPELGPSGFLASSDIRENVKSTGAQVADRGYTQVGEIVVGSFSFIEYDGDPTSAEFTGHEIHLSSCSDLSQMDVVDEDGTSVVNQKQDRVLMDVVMRGVEITINGDPETVWGVSKNAPTEEEC